MKNALMWVKILFCSIFFEIILFVDWTRDTPHQNLEDYFTPTRQPKKT